MTPSSLPNSPTSPQPKTNITPTVFWRLIDDIPQPLRIGLIVTSMALPLIVWWLVTTFGNIDAKFLPSPSDVLAAFARLWGTRELLKDTVASLYRVIVGFVLAVSVSVPLGVLMGSFPSIGALFQPVLGLMRYMPAPAFIPLLILYLGIGEEPKITLIFLGVFFFNTLMVMDTVKFVPKDLIEATYTLGGNRKKTLLKVIFPYVLPGIIDACRINLAAAWQLVSAYRLGKLARIGISQ